MQQPQQWLNTTIKKHVNGLEMVLTATGEDD
jgi:hypothetical protein